MYSRLKLVLAAPFTGRTAAPLKVYYCEKRKEKVLRTACTAYRSLPMPRKLQRIAVFCGSKAGAKPEYAALARKLGEEMVKRGVKLVYGGGNVGLMGIVAETVYAGLGPGSVTGVIPKALVPREISGTTVGELRLVDDMHTRKAAMFTESDAFIGLPGGYGTLEELLEMVTWQTLGFHDKPVGVLDVNGFYNHLIAFFDHATEEGFINQQYRSVLLSSPDPALLLDSLENYECPVPLTKIGNPELENVTYTTSSTS